jgi:hypothetical protein
MVCSKALNPAHGFITGLAGIASVTVPVMDIDRGYSTMVERKGRRELNAAGPGLCR